MNKLYSLFVGLILAVMTLSNAIAQSQIYESNGNVGIGTTTPNTKLTVNSWGSGYVNTLRLINTYGGAGTGPKIILGSQNAENVASIYTRTITSNAGNLIFQTNNGSGLVDRLIIDMSGNVIIGKSTQLNSTYKLDIAGKVRANEIVVNTTGADFVFDPNYKLRSLSEVESHIKEHGFLPEIPSAAVMQEVGMGLSETTTLLLQKIEELTLYAIEQEKRVKLLEERLSKVDQQK